MMKKRIAALAVALAAPLAWAAGAPAVSGKVLEVKDVEAYTYLRLKTADGETWAAVAKAPVKTGAEVTISNPMVMRNFESRSLKRSFDTIVFGTLGGAAGAAGAAAQSQAPAAGAAAKDGAAAPGGAPKAAEAAPVKVAKASGPNGRTVAEVNAQRSALKNKPVAIRASVAKVTPNVMGKNWIHLRDGSGSASDGSNDILVTSKEQPKVGDVVLASGVVRTDVDLGSGYAYKVLVEDVSFAR